MSYIGLSIDDLQSQIASSNVSFYSNSLNNALSLNTGDLNLNTGDQTTDDGYVVRINRHIVKYEEETRIRLVPPYSESRDFPWYARVNIGQFSKDHLGSRHIFNIPEYRNQLWSSVYGYPYMDSFGEEAIFLDSKRLRVSRTPILWRDNNIFLRIGSRDVFPGIIKDVDENNGIIYLNTDIPDASGLGVSYTYKQFDYVYKHIDMNPSVNNNPSVVGKFVLFYIIPERSQPGNVKRSRTIFHRTSHTLLGAIYSLPRFDYPVTILGALQVRQTNSVNDLNIYDTRSRGGGIKEDKYEDAIGINKNAYSVADMGHIDGVPYPGSSVVVYTLPSELKDTMSTDEIKKRASKHLALGVVPILEFE